MTVSSTITKVQWDGNDATTEFAYTFSIGREDDVVLIVTDEDGSETTLVASQYTISGIGGATGGTVTYPLSGDPLATGATLTLMRELELVQDTTFINQGGIYPAVVEGALDRQVQMIQQLAEKLGRAVLFAPTDPDNLSYEMPAAATRANGFWAFGPDGEFVVVAGFPDGSVAISSAMEAVVGANTVAAALALLGGLPTSGGTISGNLDIAGNAAVSGTLSTGGVTVPTSYKFTMMREFAVMADGTYRMGVLPHNATITHAEFSAGTGGGSFVFAAQINGTSIGGLSAVSVTTEAMDDALAASANTGAAGAYLTVAITSTTGTCTKAFVTLYGERTL